MNILKFEEKEIKLTSVELLEATLAIAKEHPEDFQNLILIHTDRNAMVQYINDPTITVTSSVYCLEFVKHHILTLMLKP